MFRKLIPSLLVLALALTPFAAFAETTFDGSIVAGAAVSVTAPFGGTVASLTLRSVLATPFARWRPRRYTRLTMVWSAAYLVSRAMRWTP